LVKDRLVDALENRGDGMPRELRFFREIADQVVFDRRMN